MKKLTNYISKKSFIGIIVAVFIVVAGVFAISANTASADCSINTTLSVGARGVEVQCLQNFLKVTPDGMFGPLTRGAVIAFQANNGLVADGIFGPISRAKWMSSFINPISPTPPSVVLCPNGMTLASNCTVAVGQTTPVLCPNGNTLMSNCTILPNSSTPTPNNGLSGGAGDIMLVQDGSNIEYEVREGDMNRRILGFRVEANGSDISLRNINVSFKNDPAGSTSTRLDRYVQNVSVWMDGVKVGSANVNEFSRNGIVYSKNISLSDAIIREGASNRKYLYIAVTALSNIDSIDLGSNSWDVKVGRSDIRFMDGTGAVLIGGPSSDITATPRFISLASSGDVRVRVSKTIDSPIASNVQVSDIGYTSDVKMLEFSIKAEGTDVIFDSLSFNVDANGTGNVENIINELALYHGSSKLGDVVTFNGDGIYKINLYNDYKINIGDTKTFKVVARVNRINTSSFAQGDSLIVSGANPMFSGVIENSNGNTITNISGTAIGERQTFYSEGVRVSNFTSSVSGTVTSNGQFSKQTYSISYNVSAFGDTYYLPKIVARDSSTTAGLVYTVQTSAGTTTTAISDVVNSSASYIASNAGTVNGYFEIPDGETRTFTVTIVLDNTGLNMATGFYRVNLNSIGYDIDQSGTPNSYILVPTQNYSTADRQLDRV